MKDFFDLYKEEIRPQLQKEFNYENVHQIPEITQIVINMGVGTAAANSNDLKAAVEDLTLISGQKPVVTKAKKSEANFKIREGQNIGTKVTLRNKRMYDLLKKLVYIALPRVRDFKGLNAKSFDGNGNYNFGLKEQIVFPEIDYDKIDKIRGMDICIKTTATNDKEAKALLKLFNMPFYN